MERETTKHIWDIQKCEHKRTPPGGKPLWRRNVLWRENCSERNPQPLDRGAHGNDHRWWGGKKRRRHEASWWHSVPCTCAALTEHYVYFPGLRELLTKTSGDIVRKFPELSQHGRGAMSLMQQVNSWALQKMIYSHSTTLPSFQKIMSTSLCYLYCPASRISQSCVCCGCWPQTFCVCMKQSKFFTLFFLIGLKSKKIQQNDRWLSFWCYPP